MRNNKEQAAPYFEKYFDATYQRDYFFNPMTRESLWEVPTGAVIADMTTVAPLQVLQPIIFNTEEDKKRQAQEKKREELRKRQEDIERLQNENMQAMYPEYYKAPPQTDAPEEVEEEAEPAEEVVEVPAEESPENKEAEREYKLFKLFKDQ